MALEVLYGPASIKIGTVGVSAITGFAFIQGLGLLAIVSNGTTYNLYAVQLDGQVLGPRSNYFTAQPAIIDLRATNALATYSSNALYVFHYLAGQPDYGPPILSGSDAIQIKVIATDRFLGFFNTGPGMQAKYTYDGVTFTPEYTFTGTAPGTLISVSPGRNSTEVCLAFSDGQIRFYDTAAKSQNGDTLYVGESPDSVWFVAKYNIFMEIKSNEVKVLAMTAAPSTLSNPTATPAVQAGYVSTLSVTLEGSQGELIEGELINWSITAGEGSLNLEQSETDDTGTATNLLIVPVGSTGNVTVEATLNY